MATLRLRHTQLGRPMWLCVECGCVLVVSGVMGVAMVVCCSIWYDGGSQVVC